MIKNSFWSKLFKTDIFHIWNRSGKPPMTMKERFAALKHLPPFFRMIWKTSSKLTAAILALRIVKSTIPVLTLYIAKLIIDEIIRLSQTAGTVDLDRLFTLIAIEFGLAIISDVLNRSSALIDSLLGDLFANQTSVDLMQHAGKLDLEQFEDAEFYDKLERARQQTSRRASLLTRTSEQAQDLFTMVSLTVGLFLFNPWLVLLLVLAVLPAFLGESHFNARSYSLVRGWTPERRELDYLRYIGASDVTAKEVKIFGLSNFLTESYKKLADKFYLENREHSIKRAAWGALFAAMSSAGYYLAYVFIILAAVRGEITIGDLTFLSGSFSRLRGLLTAILNRFAKMAEQALYLQDFFDFFALTPKIIASGAKRPFPKKIRDGFVFENVGFRYQGTDFWAIRNLSFKLYPNEKLALVGENGAGKTTLVKLLARLYDPTEGRILLDGLDLREYDPAALRKGVGVIFQDFVRFQLSARNNLAVGQIDERENMSRIEQAAALSMADQVIKDLPDGYEQRIGRRFENGVELSGGQWQKMALGRAYMREAQLLILDEPTAALDARAEYEVFQRFSDLTEGKTAVLISHRFSTVRMADRILVLDKGKKIEMGTHEELLVLGGRYAELFHLQAAGYR